MFSKEICNLQLLTWNIMFQMKLCQLTTAVHIRESNSSINSMTFSKTQHLIRVTFISLFIITTAPATLLIITQLTNAEHTTCGKLIHHQCLRNEVRILSTWTTPLLIKGTILSFRYLHTHSHIDANNSLKCTACRTWTYSSTSFPDSKYTRFIGPSYTTVWNILLWQNQEGVKCLCSLWIVHSVYCPYQWHTLQMSGITVCKNKCFYLAQQQKHQVTWTLH